VLRGDPLIGSGTLLFSHEELLDPKIRTLALTRAGAQHRHLRVRAGVRAPATAYQALADSANQSLSSVALALANVLIQPKGVDAMLAAWPAEVPVWIGADALTGEDTGSDPNEVMLREALQRWILRLHGEAQRLAGEWNDEKALAHLARVARSAQHIVALRMSPHAGLDEIQDVSVAWVRGLLAKALGLPPSHAAPIDEVRLRRLLAAAAACGDDPLAELQAMGAYMDPSTPEEVVGAVVARLKEAEEEEEMEMFTGEQIVTRGRMTPGIAAVIQPSRVPGGAPFVFLYDYASITRWKQQRGRDPTTQEPLDARNIVALTPPSHVLAASRLASAVPATEGVPEAFLAGARRSLSS